MPIWVIKEIEDGKYHVKKPSAKELGIVFNRRTHGELRNRGIVRYAFINGVKFYIDEKGRLIAEHKHYKRIRNTVSRLYRINKSE